MSVELAFDRIEGRSPARTIAFLHGILGRGNNLRTIARHFVEAAPEWSALLVDLRGHGKSPKGSAGASLEAAAGDVVQLAAGAKPPVSAMAGHSFGGKVALEASRNAAMTSLQHVVAIDSAPGIQVPGHESGSALAVIDTIKSLGRTFPSRSEFINALVAVGQSLIMAQWLAQSCEQAGGAVRFSLDLDEVRTLILDYSARDLWPVVENPPAGLGVHLVIADRSNSYSAADRERADQAAATHPQVTVNVLPAGHWVHVDDPQGLLRLLLHHLASGGTPFLRMGRSHFPWR